MISMSPYTWITSQLFIDVVMAGVLLWFIRYYYKREKPEQNYEAAFLRAEKILSEMDRISIGFERNLEEKKRLSRQIIDQLDAGLQKADVCHQQLEKMVLHSDSIINHAPPLSKDTNQVCQSVKALLDRGLTKEEASRHLEISIGEIDLLLKLKGHDTEDRSLPQNDTERWVDRLKKISVTTK
jgi:hypothetical protein